MINLFADYYASVLPMVTTITITQLYTIQTKGTSSNDHYNIIMLS